MKLSKMFKSVVITLYFSSTLIVVTDQPSFSQQLSNNIPYPTVPNYLEANPVCMMQMENGAIINLSSMCGKALNSDNKNDAAARRRANRTLALQRLNAVCKSPNLKAGMRQLCKDRLLN
jgi:hypothetical protein